MREVLVKHLIHIHIKWQTLSGMVHSMQVHIATPNEEMMRDRAIQANIGFAGDQMISTPPHVSITAQNGAIGHLGQYGIR
jgi:hypothetical protein